MKFSDHLATHITPEWRKQYIHYEVSHGMGEILTGSTDVCYKEITSLPLVNLIKRAKYSQEKI
jgi:SPX domain protein involved in polyphosphate accumulation